MKMPNMENSFVNFCHYSIPGVNSFKTVDVNCGLIPDRVNQRGYFVDQQKWKSFFSKMTYMYLRSVYQDTLDWKIVTLDHPSCGVLSVHMMPL